MLLDLYKMKVIIPNQALSKECIFSPVSMHVDQSTILVVVLIPLLHVYFVPIYCFPKFDLITRNSLIFITSFSFFYIRVLHSPLSFNRYITSLFSMVLIQHYLLQSCLLQFMLGLSYFVLVPSFISFIWNCFLIQIFKILILTCLCDYGKNLHQISQA